LWSQVLLILTLILSAAYIYRRLETSFHLFILSYALLCSILLSYTFILVDQAFFDYAIELTHLATTVLALITLLLSIRLFQPKHLRYPGAYSYVPVLIIPFYIFFIDGGILSDIILISLQVTAILVFTLILFRYQSTIEYGWILLISTFCFLTAAVLHWAVEEDQIINITINLLLCIGILTTSMKYPQLINQNER